MTGIALRAIQLEPGTVPPVLVGLDPTIAWDAADGAFVCFQATACLAMGGSGPPMT